MIALVEVAPFGRCDAVDGVGYVETEFFSTAGIPLLPLRSRFVAYGGGRIIALPLSVKSIALAWLRALTCIVGVACVAGGVLMPLLPGASHHLALLESFLLYGSFVVVGAVLIASTWLLRPLLVPAGEQRKAVLLELVRAARPLEAP